MDNSKKDLSDSKKDQQLLKNETATLNMPDVNDIPGQEHIHVPVMKEMTDTTASSSDEEGESVFDEEEKGDDTGNVSEIEKELLERSSESMAGEDDEARRSIVLDNKDEDGEALNEVNDVSGNDLDIPGAELDDDNEATGSEDEENNSYSWGQ